MNQFPSQVPLAALEAKHNFYKLYEDAWRRYRAFYEGGEKLRVMSRLGNYLIKRQKEPNEVYAERLNRMYYENYLGSIFDWYAASLFRTEPQIEFGELDEGFWAAFLKDVDRAGTSFTEFLRQAFLSALIHKTAWVLVDLPQIDAPVANRAEEDRLGKSRAYLVLYEAPDVLDWREVGAGNLEWAKIRTADAFRADPTTAELIHRDTWTIFTRDRFARYQRERKETPGTSASISTGGGSQEQLIDKLPGPAGEGAHSMAAEGRLPLLWLALNSGLWLADRAGMLVFEHFQKSNALAWAIHMGLFAMPVIFSDREWNQIMGEAYYLQLGPQDKFDWTEPKGATFDLAARNLDRLKHEIYRVCYLAPQAGSEQLRNVMQSGASKAQDYRIAEDVLKSFGSVTRRAAQRILQAVAQARGEDPGAISVRGLDNFDIRDLETDIRNAIDLQIVVRDSPTFLKENQKRLANKAMDDAPDEMKARIAEEIDSAPAPVESPPASTTLRVTERI